MMPLSSDEKSRLATELCGAKLKDHRYRTHASNPRFWQFPGTTCLVKVGDFDPENNGQHTLMVMDAMLDSGEVMYSVFMRILRWMETYDYTFGSAVCAAGLEIFGKDGG